MPLDNTPSRIECRQLVDAAPLEVGEGIEYRLCSRLRFHRGECSAAMPFRSYLRTYYETNRNVWPDMSRRAALLDAWKLTWRVTHAE